MKTEEIDALRAAAQRHFAPDGREYKYGASDRVWKDYRALATPANMLSLIGRLDTQQKELADQEVAALALVKEAQAWQQAAQALLLHWTEEGFVGSKPVEYLTQSEQMDAITEFKGAIKKLTEPAPTCPGNCGDCGNSRSAREQQKGGGNG